MAKSNKFNLDDPEFRRMVDELKTEIAHEYGVQVPHDGYWGHISSQTLGKIGAQLQKRVALLLEYKQKKHP